MRNPNSQISQIFKWLRKGRYLTQLDALNLFNCMRLGAVVYRLKKIGWNIKTKMIATKTHKRIAQYRMIK
jgi:hypothetical protein